MGEIILCKKRVMLIGPIPPPISGVEIMTKNIKEIFEKSNKFDFCFFNSSKPTNNAERGRLGYKSVFYNGLLLIKLFFYMIHKRPNIVHLPVAQNKTGFLRDYAYIMTAKLFKAKIILHTHGGSYNTFYNNSSGYVKYLIKKAFKYSWKVLVLSPVLKKQIYDITGKTGNVYVLGNCVEEPEIYPKNDDNRGKLKVLYMGTISMEKGAFDLLEVSKRFKSEDIEFIFAGEFIEKNYNIMHVKNKYNMDYIKDILLNGGNIKYLGSVYGQEKSKLLSETDVCVLTSYSEGMPMVILEALSYGIPIIASDVGAIHDILADRVNGFIVKPGDMDMIENCIELLRSNEDLRKTMSENNINLYRANFSKDIFMKNSEGLYE